jgi:putative N6-adenine-specific DNA methylase
MKNSILITVPKGLAQACADEVKALGYPIIRAGTTGVETEGLYPDTYVLNLHLRSAHHVLYMIKYFRCETPDDLYKNVFSIPWETMISADEYLSVVSHVDNPTITDSRFANVKCKDAIVDRISRKKGRRPDSGPDRTGVVINLFWKGDVCRIYIDTSGEPLSKRGYRKNPMGAPMQETLAAGVILVAGWKPEEHFVNPMCGSGTLAIEAALMGINKAPGLLRNNFGFMHTMLFNSEAWMEVRKKAIAAIRRPIPGQIIATDISPDAIDAARQNAENAGVKDCIKFAICEYDQTTVPEGNGIIMINPEYGIRMGNEAELENEYRGIGTFLKHKCQGYRGYIFTGNTTLIGKVGLKSKRKIPFYSGQIECRLYEYELFAGKKA